jgi:hypothetical protein
MDWNEVPEGVGGNPEITVWHDIIEEKASSSDPSPEAPNNVQPNIITVQSRLRSGVNELEVVEFTQKVRNWFVCVVLRLCNDLEYGSCYSCPNLGAATAASVWARRSRNATGVIEQYVGFDSNFGCSLFKLIRCTYLCCWTKSKI